MLTARINLKGTLQNELLLSALIEKSTEYCVVINGVVKPIVMNERLKNGKVIFKDYTHFTFNGEVISKGNIVDIHIAPKVLYNDEPNMRINIFKVLNENTLRIVIATIDNPCVISTEETAARGKRYIIHPEENGSNS